MSARGASAPPGTARSAPATARGSLPNRTGGDKRVSGSGSGPVGCRVSQRTSSKSTATPGTGGYPSPQVIADRAAATAARAAAARQSATRSAPGLAGQQRGTGLSRDYGRILTYETSGGGLNVLSEENPYFGIAHPNYQKFSKGEPDASEKLRRRIQAALESGELAKLQEVYRDACSRDGSRFLVESRLIGKVVRKIQEAALKELREAAQHMDLKQCQKLQEQIKSDATLAPLAKSREYAKIFALIDLSEACNMLDFKGRGKKEPALAKQQKYLQTLLQALDRGHAAGLSATDMAFAIDFKDQATKKIGALDRLQKATVAKNDKEIVAAIEEVEACGLRNGDLAKMKAKCLQNMLDQALAGSDIDELRRTLERLELLDSTIRDPEKLRQGWKKVCKAEVVQAAQGSSASKLRAAIEQCREKRVDDTLAEIIAQAEQRLPELERKEVSSKQSINRLEVAVYGRDVAQIQAWLSEARKAGASESLIGRANAVLCEDALQKAISDRNGPRLEHLIKEGQQLAVDSSVLDCALRILEQDDPKAAVMLRLSEAMSRKDTDALQDAVEDARSLGVDESKLADAVKIIDAAGGGASAGAKSAASSPTAPLAPSSESKELGVQSPRGVAARASAASPEPEAEALAASIDSRASTSSLRRSVSFSEQPVQERVFQVDPNEHHQDALGIEGVGFDVPLDELEDDEFIEGDEEEFMEGEEEEFDETAEGVDPLDDGEDSEGVTF